MSNFVKIILFKRQQQIIKKCYAVILLLVFSVGQFALHLKMQISIRNILLPNIIPGLALLLVIQGVKFSRTHTKKTLRINQFYNPYQITNVLNLEIFIPYFKFLPSQEATNISHYCLKHYIKANRIGQSSKMLSGAIFIVSRIKFYAFFPIIDFQPYSSPKYLRY